MSGHLHGHPSFPVGNGYCEAKGEPCQLARGMVGGAGGGVVAAAGDIGAEGHASPVGLLGVCRGRRVLMSGVNAHSPWRIVHWSVFAPVNDFT